jgi:hypothetical protein
MKNTMLTPEDIDLHVKIANNIVTTNLTSVGHSDETLVDLELNIAAHIVTLTKKTSNTIVQKKVGQASLKHDMGKMGERLNATVFGQTALLIDTSGTLANMQSAEKQAGIEVYGAIDR